MNNEIKIGEDLQEVINYAGELAQERGLKSVEPIHLSAAVLEKSAFVNHLLDKLGVDTAELEQILTAQLDKCYQADTDGNNTIGLSTETQKILDLAFNEARYHQDQVLTSKYLFSALALKNGEPIIRDYLEKKKITQADINKNIELNQKDEKMNKMPVDKLIKKFTTDLTALAKEDKIDPVIGRSEEIRRIIQTLSRKTKNNPVLVGEAGVGKTAIVEGVAIRIARNDVPEGLRDTKLLVLDMGALIAGSKYRGEFEDRLKKVIDFAEQSSGQAVLFIDEIHTLVGAGKIDGAMDAANLLKPALGRGLIRIIGATTLDEYRRFIEKDPALERRMQMINVPEPGTEETVSILRGIKEKYELFHKVEIGDDAIDAAVHLSDRYLTDRKLPDKAIDLIDETASRIKVELDSMPEEVDNLERRVHQLQIEIRGLKRQEKKGEEDVLNRLEKEKQELEEKLFVLKGEWLQAKEKHKEISDLRGEIDRLNSEKNRYQNESKFEKVAEIVYGKIPPLKEKLREKLSALEAADTPLKKLVTADDVRETLAKWTGIPVNKLSQDDDQKYLHLEENLKNIVVDQDRAVKTLSEAICRNRAGLSNPDKPIGSFLFLGPTGVGKTALTKAVAKELFNDEDKLIRVDMSELMEAHSVSKLIGAPPGYVGFDNQPGVLNQIRNQPYTVVLFDEVEKAHPDVINILLQILDNGRLTNSQGKVINFKNTIIILTSNLAADLIHEHHFGDQEKTSEMDFKAELDKVLRGFFRVEFINRLDEVIVFNPLSISTIEKILEREIAIVQDRLRDRSIELKLSDFFKEIMVRKGFNPEFGARSLKRTLETELLNPIAKYLLGHGEKDGEPITLSIDYDSGKIVIKEEHTKPKNESANSTKPKEKTKTQ